MESLIKKIALLFAFAFLILSLKANAQNTSARSIAGIWLSNLKDGKIEIYESGGKYFGKLIWGKKLYDVNGVSKKDKNNPDEKLRNRHLLDAVILTDFKYIDGQWKDGYAYDPTSGKTYNAIMRLRNGHLEIRGYIGISMFGKSSFWTRVE